MTTLGHPRLFFLMIIYLCAFFSLANTTITSNKENALNQYFYTVEFPLVFREDLEVHP